MKLLSRAALAIPVLLLSAGWAHAQVVVTGQWVRATVPQQTATGAFMRIQSPTAVKLVSVSSPVAGAAEVHEMAMDGAVMRMRPVSALAVPAGQPVELKPGGFHVMLTQLKGQVKDGDLVPLTLVFQGAGTQRTTVQVMAAARSGASAAAPAKDAASDPHAGHGDHKH
ncbi:copper chaperone PCu(A)C [Mitsuaria sp. GD03876]|uniref:copper chaperone PCu(A)C n=1 Tax=Mitsuaria sp. GD03876 TaxID=2975399 RepID=UPI00244A7A6E|nr:copper chaperone PCu(A)C [Mitsuaria sp. GD03876]MDH0863223.1 copper chaperone PCu(A)C [Mitsuaria sp. GD03876]